MHPHKCLQCEREILCFDGVCLDRLPTGVHTHPPIAACFRCHDGLLPVFDAEVLETTYTNIVQVLNRERCGWCGGLGRAENGGRCILCRRRDPEEEEEEERNPTNCGCNGCTGVN